jgi:small subunit ribosomal protein S9
MLSHLIAARTSLRVAASRNVAAISTSTSFPASSTASASRNASATSSTAATSTSTSSRFLSSNSSSSRRRFQIPQRENPRLRTHAVSIFHGDYSDDGTEDLWNDDEEEEDTDDDDQEGLAKLLQQEEDHQALLKAKWLKAPDPYPTVIDDRGRAYGRGGRKTASARVWIQPGHGEVVVNRMPLHHYFPRETHRNSVLEPLVATQTCGDFDLQIMVQGGGKSGQAGAARHGLARALNKYHPELYRPPLKKLGYMTRDARMVERKKTGLVKARKAPQWVRR